MSKKRPSFDAMVKLFIKQFDIPTKKDVNQLHARLDRIEEMVRKTAQGGRANLRSTARGRRSTLSASDAVREFIRKYDENGVGFAEIKEKTGFAEKKLRNIIYRLNDLGRIRRVSRGVYAYAEDDSDPLQKQPASADGEAESANAEEVSV
jgi:hypothetical protein